MIIILLYIYFSRWAEQACKGWISSGDMGTWGHGDKGARVKLARGQGDTGTW